MATKVTAPLGSRERSTQLLAESSALLAKTGGANVANQALDGVRQANPDLAIDVSKTLDSNALKTQPGFEITPPRPSTEATGMLGFFEQGADNFTTNLERQANEAKEGRDSSLDQYLRGLIETPGETELTANLYSRKGGVDDIETELNAINDQIRQEQHALTRQLERLEKNALGGTRSQVLGQMEFVERESLRKQADLYIIQQGVQGRFDSAKAIADRAVQAQLEKQRNVNEALRINYEANKDLFDKKEQRAFESAQSDRERAFEAEERRLKEISDLSLDALANGAPPSVVSAMRQAKTPEEAIAMGGQYVGLLDRQLQAAQLANIQSQIDARGSSTANDAAAIKRQQSQVSKAEVVLGKVASALKQVKTSTSGLLGGLSSKVPGTKAYDLARDLDTIKANLGFDALQAMREASPTGGALGQVAVQELAMLQATVSSLDVGQSPAQLKEALSDVRIHYSKWLETVGYTLAPDGTVVQITD
jgi:hypothetical protein